MIELSLSETRPADGRPRRADARRNYERLLEQARLAFAESGVDASLDDIARRAGVASGTLYRHFPDRMDLVAAVLADQIADLVSLGRELVAAPDALEALTTWFEAVLTHGLSYRGLAAAVMNSGLGGRDAAVAAWHAELFTVGGELLARARHTGAVVTEAEDADVLQLLGAIAGAVGDSPDREARARRLLHLLIAGLRRSD